MPWRLSLAWLVLAGAAFLCVASHLFGPTLPQQTDRFLREEDIWVLAGLTGLMFTTPLLWGPARWVGRFLAWQPPAEAVISGAAVLVALIAWLGVSIVFEGYPLSRDEDMAVFGAAIVTHGQTWAPVALEWRGYVAALEPEFVRFSAGAAFWQPAYLPVNAALRALGGAVGAASLVNPLLAALSIIAVFGVARRLWPDRPDLALVAAVLLATSSQVLVAAMTPYAMTAHLAFNLVWLWLHLHGGRAAHAGALAVGFLATGLHQLVFHPLFAAPFVLQLWLDRRWTLATVYTAAYGAICLFWLELSPLSLAVEGGAPAVGAGVAGLGGQISALVNARHPSTVVTMAENFIRFMTWQNILAAPLALLGVPAAVRAGGNMRALLLGLVLTTVMTIVLMPYQGHGWGYRYWHGLLGSIALIAALGWSRLTRRLAGETLRGAQVMFAGATFFSLIVLFPVRAAQAWGFVRPYAQAHAAIVRSRAQVVLVDPTGAWYFDDIVRNSPYLENRPLGMRVEALSAAQVQAICERNSVAVFDTSGAESFGIRTRPYWRQGSWWDRWSSRGLPTRCGPLRTPVQEIEPYGARR